MKRCELWIGHLSNYNVKLKKLNQKWNQINKLFNNDKIFYKMEENSFTQLCVWQGVVLDGFTIEEFEQWMLDNFDARVKYEREVTTNPDLDSNGNPIADTGGRNDLLFYVHSDDINKFAIQRLKAGIRWWEDVVKYNNSGYLYPQDVLAKYQLKW